MQTFQKTGRLFTDSLIRPSNVTPYASGDVISAVTTNDHYTFGVALSKSIAFSNVGNMATIVGAILHSSTSVATSVDAELWLYRTDIAEVADNSAFAPTDAESLTLLTVVDFPTASFKVNSTNSSCIVSIDQKFFMGDESAVFFGQLITKNAYVPTSAEVFTVDLLIEREGW